MSPDAAPLRHLSTGDLLNAVLDLARAHPIPLILPLAILGLLAGGRSPSFQTGSSPVRATTEIITLIAFLSIITLAVLAILLVAYALTWLATTRGALDSAAGATPELKRMFSEVRSHALGGAWTFFLYAIIVSIGTLLFIVPGLILAGALAPWAAVVIHEGKSGPAALARAWELTRGHRTPLTLLALIGFAVATVGGGIVGFIPYVGGPLTGAITGTTHAGFAILGGVFYVRVRTTSTPMDGTL